MKIPHILLAVLILLLSSALVSCAGGGATATSWPGVTVDEEGGTIYVAFNQHVYSLNLGNGSEKWRYPVEADRNVAFFAPPALTGDGQLVFGGYDNLFYSLDPQNGSLNWTSDRSGDRYIAGPLARGERIFAPSSDENLYAFNLSGNPVWSFDTEHVLWAAPVTDGEVLYLPGMDHRMYAIDIATGNSVWTTDDLGGSLPGKPALSEDGVLYVGTFGSEMLALDTSSGDVLWRAPAGGWVWGGPLLVDGMLYYGDLEGFVYAVDAADGSVVWKIQPDTGTQRAVSGKPAIIDDTLYFAAKSGILYAVDAVTGNPEWNKTFDAEFYADLVVVKDLILLAPVKSGTDAVLIALNPDGNQVWEFIPQN